MAKKELKEQLEQLLKELIDRKVIYEWYNNGDGYHWSYTKQKSEEKKSCKGCLERIPQRDGSSICKNRECEIGNPKEKHYRPFEDCNELIEHYQKKNESEIGCGIYFPSLYKPSVWVKRYEHTRDVLKNRTFLITGFEDSGVVVDNEWIGMDELFEKYKFLDDSPVGKLEE